ncbi:MAG TPA: response regulator [Pseudolabrys sp.]|nr:response regulator [Pseudolabrys sp.]
MRILIVDDSDDSRDLTEAALLSAGYDDIVALGSARAAYDFLALAKGGEPVPIDVILLDIVMPEIDGIEACAAIRNDGRYGDVPIIMVTQLNDMDSLGNAFVAGATDYITKPVKRIELLARVRSAIRLKGELTRRLERERELIGFMANWGDRRSTVWIDDVTGLFVGEVAEVALVGCKAHDHEPISVLALSIDRLEAYRGASGPEAANSLLTSVANAVRRLPALIGTVAAAYPNGLIVLVAPGYDRTAANRLAEALRTEVAALRLSNSEAIAADHVTATVAAVTATTAREPDRIRLMMQAIGAVHGPAVRAGDEVISMSA